MLRQLLGIGVYCQAGAMLSTFALDFKAWVREIDSNPITVILTCGMGLGFLVVLNEAN